MNAKSENSSKKITNKNTTKKYPRSVVKKKEQYRNKPITDNLGTFVYDEDPVAYLKARKRMKNRESKLFRSRFA